MTTLATRSDAEVKLADTRRTLAQMVEWIRSSDSADEVKEGVDRLRLAREWAKIAKQTAEIRRDLLRVEIYCFRRLAELDHVALLPANQRTAALFWRDQSDAVVEEYMARHREAATATALHRRLLKDFDHEAGVERGRRAAENLHTESSLFADPQSEAIWSHARITNDAIAAILVAHTSDGVPFTVDAVVEELLDEVGGGFGNWRDDFSDGMLEGVREVCRKAIRDFTPPDSAGELPHPAFVTAQLATHPGDPSASQGVWVRVPFANASFEQLLSMRELKREQMQAATAAFQRLDELVAHLEPAHRANPRARLSDLWGPAQNCNRVA